MFNFLKYIHPGSYYRLIHQMPQAVLIENITDNIKKNIHYKNFNSFELDLLYQNLQGGEIPSIFQNRNDSQSVIILNIHDNYVFLRRYFSLSQILYVLVFRLFSLKNPLTELMCFFYVLFNVRRIKIYPKNYTDWDSFNSLLITEKPLVTVVIPTLNRYKYLYDVLQDLERQDYKNFEVIVVDQSENIDLKFYEGWNFEIQLVQQKEKSLWLARNTAISLAKGKYIALSEDDVRMRTDWISNHLKCLDYFQTSISAGIFHPLSSPLKLNIAEPFFKYSYQFPTGNVLLKRTVFENVGLFDRQFEGQRMGDGEFGLRCLLHGYSIISNPMAFIIDIKAPVGGLRQMGSWDALRPNSMFAPRPFPSVLYLIRKYYGNKEAIYYLIKNIPESYIPYKFKKNKLIRFIYGIAFPLFLPVAIFAVIKSWHLASDKIKTGSLIAKLG